MDFFVWQRTCVDDAGNVLASASVTVKDVVSGALAQLYSDSAGSVGIGNPITADSEGFVQFYVKAGFYNITATSGSSSRTWTREAIGAPHPRTAAEISAGVTPVDYRFAPGDIRRYGAVSGADALSALTAAKNVGSHRVEVLEEYLLSGTVTFRNPVELDFGDSGRILSNSSTLTAIEVKGAAPSSFVDLQSDAAAGDETITLTDASSFSVGDWIEIRSEAAIPGENNQGAKQGELFKILFKSSNTLTLNGALHYDYKISDNARAGIATVVDGVTIRNYRFNKPDHDTIGFRPLVLEYCANVRIYSPEIHHTRAEKDVDITGADGIDIQHCVNVRVVDATLENIGYYGIHLFGACRDVQIVRPHVTGSRHASSINHHSGYGEPIDVTIRDGVSYYSTLSSWDTHDLGRDVLFENCVAWFSGDDGFQIRARRVTLRNCRAVHCANDGVGPSTNASELRIIGGEFAYNGRYGVNAGSRNDIDITDVWAHDNVWGGIATNGGVIRGGILTDNGPGTALRAAIVYGDNISPETSPQAPLIVEGAYAPKSSTQTYFVGQYGSQGHDYHGLVVRNCYIPDYDTDKYFGTNANATGTDRPYTEGNIVAAPSSTSPSHGVATLSSGTVTVSTTAVVLRDAGNFHRPIASTIELTPITDSENAGTLTVTAMTDRTGFTITSSNASDDRDVLWRVST